LAATRSISLPMIAKVSKTSEAMQLMVMIVVQPVICEAMYVKTTEGTSSSSGVSRPSH